MNDMRVKVSPTGLYTYPDVAVACGEVLFDDEVRDTLLNPVVLVEVLSESSERYDRGEKFAAYRRLESLQEYVLADPDTRRVEVYRRNERGNFELLGQRIRAMRRAKPRSASKHACTRYSGWPACTRSPSLAAMRWDRTRSLARKSFKGGSATVRPSRLSASTPCSPTPSPWPASASRAGRWMPS